MKPIKKNLVSLGMSLNLLATMNACVNNTISISNGLIGKKLIENHQKIQTALDAYDLSYKEYMYVFNTMCREACVSYEDYREVCELNYNRLNKNYSQDLQSDNTYRFTKPLTSYAFHYYPETNRTDVELQTVLDAYGISYEDYMNIFVRVIYAEGGALHYEEAYALTTLKLNLLLHGGFGDNLMSIVTHLNLFPNYAMEEYKSYDIEELEKYPGWQAIRDCLTNFVEDQTNRMHPYLHYETICRVNTNPIFSDEYKKLKSQHIYSDVNNLYSVVLPENEIIYQNISLGSARNLSIY